MIFVFVEDGRLEVVAGLKEARRNYEGIDVESGVFRFYDEHGTYLEPRFTKPNRTGRFLGIFRWVESGEFELVPAPDTAEDDISICLLETGELEPNPWFGDLEEVKRFLAKSLRGAEAGGGGRPASAVSLIWTKEVPTVSQRACPRCGSAVPDDAQICANCKTRAFLSEWGCWLAVLGVLVMIVLALLLLHVFLTIIGAPR